MSSLLDIDVTIDLRADTPAGKGADSHSPTLRRYHQLLWSKPLPNGGLFDLSSTFVGAYLHHKSDLGEFHLSSDTVIRTFRHLRRAAPIIDQIPEAEREAFSRQGYTIGPDGVPWPPSRRPPDNQLTPRNPPEDRGPIRSHP